MNKDKEVRELAYNIWEQEGRPQGKDVEHYLRAKSILEESERKRILELASQPSHMELEPSPPIKQLELPPKRKKKSTHSRR